MSTWHDNFIEERLQQKRHDNFEKMKDNLKRLSSLRCLHKNCTSCFGSGKKKNGTDCIHMISCSCPKCSPGVMKVNKHEEGAQILTTADFDKPNYEAGIAQYYSALYENWEY